MVRLINVVQEEVKSLYHEHIYLPRLNMYVLERFHELLETSVIK